MKDHVISTRKELEDFIQANKDSKSAFTFVEGMNVEIYTPGRIEKAATHGCLEKKDSKLYVYELTESELKKLN